jgi:predicted CopG family antitoxin
LVKLKKESESFDEEVLRLASARGNAKAVLEYLEGLPSTEDLAESIENAMRRMRKAPLTRTTAA